MFMVQNKIPEKTLGGFAEVKDLREGDWNNRITGGVLVLHTTDPDFSPSIPYGSPGSSGIIP